MAELFKNVFGGAKPEAAAGNPGDSDFADFAGAPDPVPEAAPEATTLGGATPVPTGLPYTKWYRVQDRHSLSEFKIEGVIIAISCVIFLLHWVGARANRNKAKAWARANGPALASEFALVGYGGVPTMTAPDLDHESLVKEKSLFEFATFATGRQNVSHVDVKLTLSKKFNPFVNFTESVLANLFDSFAAPKDIMEATMYPFDGRENAIVPALPGSAEVRAKDAKSAYDGFVWAVTSKDSMQALREERYDLSLTFTRDQSKLPNWATTMSESAEITELLLTPELVEAIKAAEDLFECIVVTDQPIDKPKTLEEANPRKRVFLKYRLPSNNDYQRLLPLFSYFLRLPDLLASSAHFRPEVLKKVRASREQMAAQIKKAEESEKSEERLAEKEKAKKAKRDAALQGLDAKAQKKYLEKEKEKEMRRAQKKQTARA